ncbi:hypothetical protein MWMV17_MWMV17_01131 [Acinetobacter calcoaceticus]|uniref:DUF4123 domain-containing protein n=1 Tax=Acinetobacter calcoaceticus DSM 30006 = CIP 81.8 TaxID=981331 RepID=A0ABN0K7T8_ACICA|nr:hypothetical protein [Acinetobacter calcoaceticus]ENV99454.1 hypothetical protein F936_02538 [Acinetobacter calcoaceticus DSM 30006 = CIP 81.8]CAI3119556.1 hypothetical protein MWMV17_MWMV17_01131 [Acinetobacter calcoaceticus]SUU53792.1 Uncharacterised protein [Acinetobacter calcoaceticus]
MSLSISNTTQYEDLKDITSKIEEQCIQILNEYGQIIFLLDTTLNDSIFNGVIDNLSNKNIAYIPLAHKKEIAKSNLFFICIDDKKVFEQVKEDLLQNLSRNKNITNDCYFVHGFGVAKTRSLEELRDQIKTKLVISDQDKKILFRWYDPRVLIYLDEIFKTEYVDGLLNGFKQWHFLHPKGLFGFKSYDESQSILNLTKVNLEQSIDLDLIEIANNVFQQLNEFEQVDLIKIHPVEIHQNLKEAYHDYGIQNHLDLVTYGLYSQIIHKNFIQHPVVTNVLYDHCVMNEMSFTDAMDYVTKDLYEQIAKELNG